MRIGAMIVAICAIVVGVVGIASPGLLTAIRREYFATPVALYSADAVRVVMGVIVILVASTSRAPKTLRVLGVLMCLQALTATLAGPERARAILEWEAKQNIVVLRVGALAALAAGGFVAFAVMGRPQSGSRESLEEPGERVSND